MVIFKVPLGIVMYVGVSHRGMYVFLNRLGVRTGRRYAKKGIGCLIFSACAIDFVELEFRKAETPLCQSADLECKVQDPFKRVVVCFDCEA